MLSWRSQVEVEAWSIGNVGSPSAEEWQLEAVRFGMPWIKDLSQRKDETSCIQLDLPNVLLIELSERHCSLLVLFDPRSSGVTRASSKSLELPNVSVIVAIFFKIGAPWILLSAYSLIPLSLTMSPSAQAARWVTQFSLLANPELNVILASIIKFSIQYASLGELSIYLLG